MRRAGFGLALVVVMAVGLVLAAILAAQAYLASGSASAVQRLGRAEQARALAESALEEALVVVGRDANGASGTEAWTKFRVKAGAGFVLTLPLNRLEALSRELARYPLCQQPPPEVTARVRFQMPLDRSANPLHDQRFGTLELTAAVSYQLDRTTERRTLTRWYEFKVVQTTLPFPFDRTLVYLHNAGKIVNANALVKPSEPPYANLLMHDAATTLQSAPIALDGWIGRLDGESQQAQQLAATSPAAAKVAARLQAGAAALRQGKAAADAALARYQAPVAKIVDTINGEDPPYLLGFPLIALAQAERAANGLTLDQYNLPVLNRKLADRRKVTKRDRDNREIDFDAAMQDLYSQLLSMPGTGSVDLGAACAALAAAVDQDVDSASAVLTTYQDFETQFNLRSGDAELKDFQGYLDLMGARAWTNAPAAGATDAVLVPGKAQFAIPGALCADAASMDKALGEVLDRYGPPFQGTIHIDNAGGAALVLDGDADARWRGFAGRLTLVTTGSCRLKNVTRANPAQHLVTVICQGELQVAGTVQASLVAFGRFLHPAGETVIQGHLVLDQPAHELANDADVEAVLANVKMVPDPLQPTTAESGAIKGDRVAVLFGPVPVYARAPRQEEK